MSRAMPLTGHSVEAEMSAPDGVKSVVGNEVRRIIEHLGEATHDEICAEYHRRQKHDPRLPRVTDQRIRSATSRATAVGDVVASLVPGLSANGHKATNWTTGLKRTAA